MNAHLFHRSALVLAVLAACVAAHAQSGITISGRVDLTGGKDTGSADKRMGPGAMSHVAFRGNEDLGGGLSAFFNLETRINAQEGTTNNPGAFLNNPPGTFWSQASYVGQRAATYGTLTPGRQMPAAVLAQVLADPWLWDNTTLMFASTTGHVGNLWYNDAVTYGVAAGAFSLTAQVAEAASNPGWAGVGRERPYSFGLGWTPGKWEVRFGYEKPADGTSEWSTLYGAYDFGFATLKGLVGHGRDTVDAPVRTWTVSTIAPVGVGQIRAAYGHYKRDGVVASEKVSAGYYHYLSKRTAVYANATHDTKAVDEKSGYELGVQHVF